jgi:Porin subfamily
VNVDYSGAATDLLNTRVNGCGAVAGSPLSGGIGSATTPVTMLAGNTCNPDFQFYQVGSRTLWNPVRNLDIGLDVVYTKLYTAYQGPASLPTNGSRPAVANGAIEDQDVWSAMFRWQRNFYP